MRYLWFLKGAKLPSKKRKIATIEKVMKKCYLKSTETGYRAQWRTIVGWVDSIVFKNIDSMDDENFTAAKQEAEHILLFLRSWYQVFYLKEDVYGYIDVPLSQELQGHTVLAVAPIIKVADIPTVIILDEVVQSEPQLYNNIYARGLAYMLSKSLGYKDISIQYMAVGSRGGKEISEITLGEEEHLRTESMISDLCTIIAAKVDFPSVTEMCQVCPFSRRCKL